MQFSEPDAINREFSRMGIFVKRNSLPELQIGNFNKRLMLGFRRTVCIVTDGGGIAAVVANSFA